VKPIHDCFYTEGVRDIISYRGICAGGDGAGSCFGDSGGGFFTMRYPKWFLRGVTSSGLINTYGDCDVDNQAVFTDVANFEKWIEDILGGRIKNKCR
jgi:chymotrypsin